MTEASQPSAYEQARHRAAKKRNFRGDLGAYGAVNLVLIAVWALTGGGYFWPAWVILGWGIGLLLAAWNMFYRRELTEADIQKELRHGTG